MEKLKWMGGDFSHWNTETDFVKYVETCEFFAHKATENNTMIDKKFYDRVLRYMDIKPAIAYHVLNPKTSPIEQAEHFTSVVLNTLNHSDKKRIGYMLDIEYSYFKDIGQNEMLEKIVEFCNRLVKLVNHRPIVYLGDLYDDDIYHTLKCHDWLIWIARYAKADRIKHNQYMDFWQYTSNPYDKDIFYGTEEKMWSFLRGWK